MRYLTLVLEGLSSIRERQSIALSELTGLFAITGPTGAGKTSVFDGLCLALWGQFPRSGKNGVKNFISLGAGKMFAQLVFEVGERQYKVTRTFYPTRSQEAALERLDMVDGTAEWRAIKADAKVPEITTMVEDIVGMDYETYTKVVMLPQGAFDKVLRGDRTERRALWKQLLGVGRYEKVGQKARAKWKECDETRARIEGRLTGELAEATVERLQELSAGLERVQQHREQLNDTIGVLEASRKKVAVAQERILDLERGEAIVSEQRAELERVSLEGESLKRERSAMNELVQRAQETFETRASLYKEARERMESREGSEHDLTVRMTHLNTLANLLAEGREDVEALTKERDDIIAQLEDMERRVREAVEEIDALSAKGREVRDRLAISRENLKLQARKGQLRADRDMLLARKVENAEAQERAKGEIASIQGEIAKIRHRLDSARVEELREQLIGTCRPGDPCPVCTIPLKAMPIGHREGQETAVLNKDLTKSEATRLTLETLRARLAGEEENLSGRVREVEAELEAMVVGEVEDGGEIETEMTRLTEQLGQQENVLSQRRTEAAQVAKLKGKVDESWHAACARNSAYGSQVNTLMEALSIEGQLDAPRLREEQRDAQGALEAIRARALEEREAERLMRAAEIEMREAENRGAELARAEEKLEEGIKTWPEDGMESFLPEGSVGRAANTVETLRAWLESIGLHMTVQRQQIEATVASAQDALSRALNNVHGLVETIEPGMANKSSEDPATLARRLDVQLAESYGRLFEQERVCQGQVRERVRLEGERQEVEVLRERCKRLADVLKEDQFTDYLLSNGLAATITRAATELEMLSAGRYGMDQDASQILIIDHTHADRTRVASTLSGGESFMASLALGLALAGRAPGDTSRARQEVLFIDEGFDTLDKGILDEIVEALERLEGTGRAVGVITHVAELAERINMHLLVEPGANGSRISLVEAGGDPGA